MIRIKGLRMFVTVLVLNCCFFLGFSKFLQEPRWPGQVSVVDSAVKTSSYGGSLGFKNGHVSCFFFVCVCVCVCVCGCCCVGFGGYSLF